MSSEYEDTALAELAGAFESDELLQVAPLLERMLHDGVVIQDRQARVVYANAKAAELLRISADQLRGSGSLNPRWQSITAEGDPYPGEKHPAMVVLQTGGEIREELMGVRVGDESLRWLSIDASAIDLASGRYAIAVFTDVTRQLEGYRRLR
ncbi:MAG: PAS domain-containing protein, partial [Actinomycetota bacterium]